MKSKKNNEVAISNNRLNVTVGTLADAQMPNMRKSKKGKGANENGTQKDRYIYCDFAQIEEEEYDVDYEIDQEGLLQALDESTTMAAAQTVQYQSISYLQQPPPVLRASGWVRSQRFPTKLYALLSQPQLAGIITWMPHGRSWKVLKPRVFETSVLPVFFESDNYHSFNRVINAWSFRRKSTGPDRGSYFHELFLRGKPHLQKYMRRLPRTHKKLAMAKSEEPDFFELHKTSPLPTLEQARLNLESRKFLRLREQLGKDTAVPVGIADRNRSPLAPSPHDAGTNEQHNQHIQAKQQEMKRIESWREDHGSLTLAPITVLQSGRHHSLTKEGLDQFSLRMNRKTSGQSSISVPESLFRFKQDDLDLHSRVSGHPLMRHPQQQHKATIMRQHEQDLLARHHRAQMIQIEQEQFLRAHQMDFFQQQRSGY
mmetsp:Transcript_10549/g.24656  ORF Transcript_10549/g.24656 Transcript_10549/m.24656 type:complete len:427 (-) Transcript_10549:82-1362(-)